MRIGRLEIIIHAKICKGKMMFQKFSDDGLKLYKCTKCKYSKFGYANSKFGEHKPIK